MKIKKSNLSDANKYVLQNYPSSGIFLNTDKKGTTEYFFVNHKNKNCSWLGNEEDCKDMFKDEELEMPELLELSEIKEGTVSETFALRMLSVGLHSELLKYKDIK